MAYNTASYHNNNIPGNIDLAKFKIRESTTTPKYALGTRVTLSDGRSFRYASFGAAVTQARVCSMDINESSSTVTTVLGIIAPVSANTTSDGTAGQKFIQFTLAGILQNELAGGYFTVCDGTGEGFTYRIKGNSATSGPATGDTRIEFYDDIEVEPTSASAVFALGNLYANLQETVTADTDQIAIGVTTAAHAVDTFGWVQTWGAAAVETGTDAPGIVTGDMVAVSDDTDGAVQAMGGGGTSPSDNIAEPIVGWAMNTSITSDHMQVYLQITP